jgi:hypothetical protein
MNSEKFIEVPFMSMDGLQLKHHKIFFNETDNRIHSRDTEVTSRRDNSKKRLVTKDKRKV